MMAEDNNLPGSGKEDNDFRGKEGPGIGKEVPRRSNRLTKEEKIAHTKRMGETVFHQKLGETVFRQKMLDHPPPAAAKKNKQPKSKRSAKKTPAPAKSTSAPAKTTRGRIPPHMMAEDDEFPGNDFRGIGKELPRRSNRLTNEDKMAHTERMRETVILQKLLDHPPPAPKKNKKPKAKRSGKKTPAPAKKTPALVHFTNAGRGRVLKNGEYEAEGEIEAAGEFVGGMEVDKDAPVSLIKNAMDMQVEAMMTQVGDMTLATRSEVVNVRIQMLAFARVAATLSGTYDMIQLGAEDGYAPTGNQSLLGGGVSFEVHWIDQVDSRSYKETTQIVTKEFLSTYFHDLYFQLIVCDEEMHKPALDQLKEWNFSYVCPTAFWSVIFHSRGVNGVANENTFDWEEALSHATPDLEWDGVFDRRYFGKKNYEESSEDSSEEE